MLACWVDRVEFIFPILKIALLSVFRLDHHVSTSFSLFCSQRLLSLLYNRFILLWKAFHLARLIELNEIDCLKNVIHLLFVDLTERVISLSQLRDFLVDVTSVTIPLISASPTSADNLLISTFRRTISSVMLLCFLMDSFSFSSWLLRRWTLFLIMWRFSCTSLSSLRLWLGSYLLEWSILINQY